jgi:hypothetical protein
MSAHKIRSACQPFLIIVRERTLVLRANAKKVFLTNRPSWWLALYGSRFFLPRGRPPTGFRLFAKAFLAVTLHFSINRHFFVSVSCHFWCSFPYFLRKKFVCMKFSFSMIIQIKLIRLYRNLIIFILCDGSGLFHWMGGGGGG